MAHLLAMDNFRINMDKIVTWDYQKGEYSSVGDVLVIELDNGETRKYPRTKYPRIEHVFQVLEHYGNKN